MGRPRKEFNWEEFDKLCHIQCTKAEIAYWFDCSEDTVENRVKEEHGVTFSAYHKKKSQGGKMSVRRKLFQHLEKGNVTIAIWLSKQYLGMKDQPDPVFEDEPEYPVI